MTPEKFAQRMKGLLKTCTDEEIQLWVQFAEECVSEEQYVNYRPRPAQEAVASWLNTTYASLYFIKKEFGTELAAKVFALSKEKLCLCPFEMREAAMALKRGDSPEQIRQLMEGGFLIGDIKFPSLKDVHRDRRRKHQQAR